MAEANRTEDATPKKMREARDKGEVARSMEIGAAINMIVGLTMVFIVGRFIYSQFQELIQYVYQSFAQVPLAIVTMQDLMRTTLIKTLVMSIPIMVVVVITTVLANYLQIGFKIATKAIEPKLSKLNPITGFQKIFSMRGWIELIKSTLKISFVVFIVWSILKARIPQVIVLSVSSLDMILIQMNLIIWEVIWKVGLFFVFLGVLDYIWQRHDFMKRQRMTKQEVRDEFKQQEGDQQIKGKRKSKHREMSMRRMAAEVARADVVTTNPTHYAVALRYDQHKMRAPKVVAKGENHWAQVIKRIAKKHNIPIIENKPVTRAIYHAVEVGQEIPPMLYRAVAEILAALFKIKAKRGLQS